MRRPRALGKPTEAAPVSERSFIPGRALGGLKRTRGLPDAAPAPPVDPRPTEAHVEQTVTQFLELDGWRAFKMEAQSDRSLVARFMKRVIDHALLRPLAQIIGPTLKQCMRGAGVGELGMPDHLYIRYIPTPPGSEDNFPVRVLHETLWIEFKRPGKSPAKEQRLWHDRERLGGALVLVIDDIDFFIAWYKRSGLARRV